MYNPFKPHIILCNNRYYIRKLSFIVVYFAFYYIEVDKQNWWQDKRMATDFSSTQEAKLAYQDYLISKKKPKEKVITNL